MGGNTTRPSNISETVKYLRVNRLSYVTSRFDQAHDDSYKPVGPVVVSILVFSVGLIFWISYIFSINSFNLAETREFWLDSDPSGLTLFETFTIVCLLLGHLIVFDVLRFWINKTKFSIAAILMYLSCVAVLGTCGRVLYAMQLTILSDSYFNFVSETEDLRGSHHYVGYIRNYFPDYCDSTPLPCYLVELEDGREVLAHVRDNLTIIAPDRGPTSELVIVASMVGSKTGIHSHFAVEYYISGDTELIWGQFLDL